MSSATKKDYSGQSFAADPARHDTYPFIDPHKHDLTGKRVFVTGASKGIGRSLAIAYAQAGASKIAIGARSSLKDHVAEIEEAAEKAGRKEKPEVISIELDVTSLESVQKAAKSIEKWNGLDILVNNAGYLSDFNNQVESDADEWWMNFEVNIKGVFFMHRTFIPLLLKGSDPKIVNLSSIGAQGVDGNGTAYKTTKLAINRLSEHTAAEFEKDGLLVFAIHPGGVPTELAQRMPKHMHSHLGDTPELAAHTIVWLTAEKRDWLSKRYISSNWDMEALLKMKDKIVEEDLLKVKLQI